MLDDLPPIPIESWQSYKADQFGSTADAQIATLDAPTSSDSLTNPIPRTVPDLAAGPPPEAPPAPVTPAASDFPAPDAPITAPFQPPQPAPDAPYTAPLRAPAGPTTDTFPPTPRPLPQPSASGPVAPAPITGSPDLIVKALNAADQVGVDPHLFVSLVQQESNFNPNARSPVGATGLTQLMPETARGLGVTDPNDPAQNLLGGARYLKQQLDRFGGDVVKALAAYNAGPGAVEQYGGVPPYKETQSYVDKILGRLAAEQANGDVQPADQPDRAVAAASPFSQAPKPLSSQSQFGDPQLSSDEAYAACGPAAAVRFATAYGRNPTLKEALDLAKTVGWTSAQGMAGLSSEKALMDKMGVPTKVVNGPAWDAFAREAQTGNPVTISTAGHYFTADGFNPDTGAFHVGQSGLDLKHGAEWMTPAQMTNLMGAVQGGLLADNPTIPQPSTVTGIAQQAPSSPLDALGQFKDSALSTIGNAAQGAASAVSGAVNAFTGPQPMTAAMQPTPSDILTNPPLVNTPLAPTNTAAPQPTVFDKAGETIAANQANPPLAGLLQSGVGQAVGNTVAPYLLHPESYDQSAIGRIGTDNPPTREELVQEAPMVGGAVQPLGTASYDAAAAASPELSKLRAGRTPTVTPPTESIPARLNAARSSLATDFVRATTDRQVDINHAQELYAKALGRPLNADEMAAELQRLSADPAAAVHIDEGLKPAIQSVGDDYNALVDYVTARSNVQIADHLGNDARKFSGDISKTESQKALTDIETALGPDRFKTVQDAADQVSQFSKDLRQRLVDSGVLSQDQADAMEAQYPDWAKTRILDYMKDPAGGQGAGTKLGLSDRNVRAYSLEGTTKAREDPIASTVAYTHQVQQMANKNTAFQAMLKIDQASPAPMLRRVSQDFTPTKNQVAMIGFVDGQKVKYVTDNRALGEAINGAGVMSTPEWTSAWQKVFRSLATSRNPLFLAGNAALDIPTATFRTAIRDGGPQALPGIMADMARGYADAFQGLLQGEFKGVGTSAFLKGGGGQSGYFTGGEGQTAQTVASLRRKNVFEINGKADLLRLAKDLVTLKPVEALGERIELGPRVMAYNRALQRGANQTQAVIDGRTVTIDFSQGGTVTKYLNNFIPFFNVAAQAPVQIARAFRDNPGAFLATTGSLIGMPAVAAEAWNHADPQRAADYKDVPDSVKNQGIVVMLPGEVPVDKDGNRKPLYALLKLREWAPFASIARDATARALGDDSKSWQDMARSAGAGVMPTNATSLAQAGAEPLAGIPVLPAGMQLAMNKDFFRNRDIVTQRNDQNASQVAKTLAPVVQAAVDKLGINAEIRPSAIDFLIRDQGAGVGAAVLGAGDLGQPRRDNSPQSLPVVGGLVGKFAGSQGGEALQQARDNVLSASSRQILRQNGVNLTPGPVSSAISGVPLRLSEETRYQELANQYIDQAIQSAASKPVWRTLSAQGKEALLNDMVAAARERAGTEILKMLPAATKQQRLVAKSAAP